MKKWFVVITAVLGICLFAGTAGHLAVDAMASDATAPSNGTVTINDNNAATNTTAATLNLAATDDVGVTGYYASETDTLSGGEVWTGVTSATSYTANVSFTLSSGNGEKTVYVWYKDESNNISDRYSDTITLDTSAPSVTLNAVTSPTNVTSQTITGTVEAGATVSVATDTAASDGAATVTDTSWSYTITGLVSGANGITVTATDAASNTATATGSITLDTTAPSVTLNAVTSPTNVASQTITGTVEAGATVSVATDTAASDGAATVTDTSWSYTITGLVSGANGITVTATDAASNTATATGSITLDTTAPSVTLNAVTSPINVASQTITGTVEAGATVSVATDTAASDGSATVTDTSWSYTITGLVSGANGITVTATDAASNTATAIGSITLDTTAPSVTLNAVTSPTNVTSQTITGTVEAGATVSVATDTAASDGAATVTGTSWSYTITGLVSGANGITVTATDAASNTATATGSIRLDVVAPNGSVTINNNDERTYSSAVTLNLAATDADGMTGYYASEISTAPSSGAAGWHAVTSTSAYSADVPFTLSAGLGRKTVFVWYKDAAGNVSNSVYDQILLEKEFPDVTFFRINNGAAKTSNRTVTLNNESLGSPTHYMASESPGFAGATWLAYSTAPQFTLSADYGGKAVYFKVKTADDESAVVHDGITLVQVPVVSQFKINNGAAETVDSMVRLNNIVTGVKPTHFMASESPLFVNAVWLGYSTAPYFRLSEGEGVKTVYFKVKNADGESEAVNDSIIAKKKSPTVATFQINNGATETRTRTVRLNNTTTGGKPTHYMASESPAFVRAVWQGYNAAPTFTLSAGNGAKTVYFKVKNGYGESPAVSDGITLRMAQPVAVAHAGVDQFVRRGSVVTLDGSKSFSTEGCGPLTYEWSIVSRPVGMRSELSDPKSVSPTFTLSRHGACELQLVITDGNGTASEPDSVVVSTQDTTPVAHAGRDQSVNEAGSRVTLNGSQSYDPDGGDLTYQWAFISIPAESAATLKGSGTTVPAFVADVPGDYVIQLTVTDEQNNSSSDTVTVSFGNARPAANAGKSVSVKVGDVVTLDGEGTDANGDALSYRWVLSSLPGGSQSELADSSARVTTFTPDRAGAYVAQLVVSDGKLDSEPSAIQIQAFTHQTGEITALQEMAKEIAELDSSAFRNSDMQNTLLNKINAVIASEEAGKHNDAANQLRNDVLPKMGGTEKAEGNGVVWINARR